MSKCTIKYTVHLLVFMQPPPKQLLDQVHDALRLKHYAYRTEETYIRGFAATSSSTTSAILKRWAKPKARPFSRI